MGAEEQEAIRTIAVRVANLEEFVRSHAEDEERRIAALETSYAEMRAELAENTLHTTTIRSDTAVIREFVESYKAAKLVGRAASGLIKWVAAVGAGLLTMWVIVRTGRLP